MPAYQRLTMTIPDTTATWESWVDLNGGDAKTAMRAFINWLEGCAAGRYAGTFSFTTAAIFGTATITVSAGGSANNETATICGITITAKTSGADTTAGEFNISATAATQAASMVTMFNETADFDGIITASRNSGVVTLTAAAPGTIGNALTALDVNLANVVISDFITEATGAEGTSYTLNLS